MLALVALLLNPVQVHGPEPGASALPVQTDQSARFEIHGFPFESDRPVADQVRRSLIDQVRIVLAAPLSPRVLAFFRERPIRLVTGLRQPGATGLAGVTLLAAAMPPDNPVLLHELIHLYHYRALARGIANPVVEQAYNEALASGRWPARSYMLSNKGEFFAMTASAILHGRVARPPFTGAAVAEAMPAYQRWILQEFSRP